jgi:hypothetical protein
MIGWYVQVILRYKFFSFEQLIFHVRILGLWKTPMLWSLRCLYRYFFNDTASTSGAEGEKFGESLEIPIICSVKLHFLRCLTVCLTAVYSNNRVVHFSYKSD